MAGKLTIGKVIRTVGKINREIEQVNKKQKKEFEKYLREKDRYERREQKALEKDEARSLRENEKEQKKQLKLQEKEKKDNEKQQAIVSAEAKKIFSLETIKEHDLAKKFESKQRAPIVDLALSTDFEELKSNSSPLLSSAKKIKSAHIDCFLLSGKFNFITGMDGLKACKDCLLNEIKDGDIILSDEQIESAIFRSGLFYEYEYTDGDLRNLEDTSNWRANLRIILTKAGAQEMNGVHLENLKLYNPRIFSSLVEESIVEIKKAVKLISVKFRYDIELYLNKIKTFQIKL